MPGNEVGDRVHNFFGQENLSQGQYHSQEVDGNWPGLSNNLWAGSQRPTVAPFISNLKNFNLQQSGRTRCYLPFFYKKKLLTYLSMILSNQYLT